MGDPRSNLVEGRILDPNDWRPLSFWKKILGLFSDSVSEFRKIGELQTRNCNGRTGLVLKIYGRDRMAGGQIFAGKIARILGKPVVIELASEEKKYSKTGRDPVAGGRGLLNLLLASFLIVFAIAVAGWVLPIAQARVGESFFFLALLFRFSVWFLFGV